MRSSWRGRRGEEGTSSDGLCVCMQVWCGCLEWAGS
jgi:hypothetical protein